jgi:hypothetical protein
VTLIRNGALKWWRTVHYSVELTSEEDFYAVDKKFQLDLIKKARDRFVSLSQTNSMSIIFNNFDNHARKNEHVAKKSSPTLEALHGL